MANSDVLVTVSGAAFSLLFYENVRSSGDQMGFLLGDVSVYITKKVTDSDRQIEHEKKHINIDTVVACPKTDVFHDNIGVINTNKVNSYIGENGKRVVGWFRFRRNCNLTPTLRDKILHKELSTFFDSPLGASKEDFVMCLLNHSENRCRGTHKFRHVFLRYKNRIMEALPLRINNLGDDASRLDGSDYKPTPVRQISKDSDAFNKLLQTSRLSSQLSKKSGVDAIKMIEDAAEKRLSILIPELCESENKVAQLEMQIEQLRERMYNSVTKKKGAKSDVESVTMLDNFDNDNNQDQIELLPNVTKKCYNTIVEESPDIFNDCSNEMTIHKEKKKSERNYEQDHVKMAADNSHYKTRSHSKHYSGRSMKIFHNSTTGIVSSVSEQVKNYESMNASGKQEKKQFE